MTDESEELKQALARFKESDESWNDNRREWLEDVKFARLGDQWPEKIKKQREVEGRPCLTINKLPAFIRQVVNDARQNKPSIKCHPVDDSADVETAEILDGLIRNIEYTSNADVAYDTALNDAVSGGFGYFRIDVDYATDDSFDKDIKIVRIANPLTVYGDARSQAADSSDWKYCFVTELVTEKEHKRRWPKVDMSSFETDNHDELESMWFEGKLIRIAEYWKVETEESEIVLLADGTVLEMEQYTKNKQLFDSVGITLKETRTILSNKVSQRLMNGKGFLEPETEWAGKYIPIVPCYGEEVNVEGKRHFISLTRPARDPQMMFNFWRTASTELVALAPKAPWIGPTGAFDTDADKWESANVTNHPYIEYDGNVAPERQPFAGVPAGALQEAMNAADDIKSITGIHDASLGAQGNETSGKAIIARQRESDLGTFHFIDNEARAIRHAGRIIVDLIPHVYSGPRIMRVIGKEGDNDVVKVNQPHQDENGVEKVYDLTTGKYDVTCEVGPSYTTQREEAAAQMSQFIQSYPQGAPLIADLLAKNLDWPGAEEIAKRFKAMLPPQIQGQDGQDPIPPAAAAQMQQMSQHLQQAQMQMQEAGKHIQDLTNQLQQAKSSQLADQVAMMKVQVDEFNAQTARMKAQGDLQNQPQDTTALERLRLEYEDKWKKLEADTKIILADMAKEPQEVAGMPEEPGSPDTNQALALAIEGFTAALGTLRQPKVATMPDGRQVRIE